MLTAMALAPSPLVLIACLSLANASCDDDSEGDGSGGGPGGVSLPVAAIELVADTFGSAEGIAFNGEGRRSSRSDRSCLGSSCRTRPGY